CHRPLLRLAVRERPVAPVHAPAAVRGSVARPSVRPAPLAELDQVRPALARDRVALKGHATSSTRAFSRYLRPIFAVGLPSVITMSLVTPLGPRISDEPAPIASAGPP